MLMEKYICIHGHFYQPPRENPWLEDLELQDSAYPYHDWNERIAAECYAPNTVSRILDGEGRIIRLPNNYAKISFNFGPTLLNWLSAKAPEIYAAILAADHQSQQQFSGHGSALAQAYNHMIMPLANRRDKYTQVLWGIRDFEHRFGRLPEGMWLPETAVDLETLDIMAELGIRFTILAPHQAHKVRRIGQGHWRDVSGGRIDPTTAYLLKLPSGRTINLFFYDGPISRAVAFEELLARGENLASRLVNGFSNERPWPQVVHIATDGETYGHHRLHGDMALAYALDYLENRNLARLTNYGEFLKKHPPVFEVKIFENSSWSCAHGVERWCKDCGFNSGMHSEWSQAWRTPLREALDWLRDNLAPQYEEMASRFLKDPWAARDDYISVILKRDRQEMAHFLERHASRGLDHGEMSTVLKLLEMQRHAMLMYTSCGWFFDELSGLETVQVLQYAGRVVQLARDILEDDHEAHFLERLQHAKSNIPEHGDGRRIFEKFVKPAMVDLLTVGAHYAISSLFEDYQVQDRIFCYTIDREDYRLAEAGKAKLAVGRIRVTSDITWNSAAISFAVLHFGDHNLCGGVREFQGEEAYGAMAWEVTEAFSWADFPETIRRIDQHFEASTYSLRSLFRDEQRKILDQIMELTLEEVWSAYGRLYSHNVPLMRFHMELGVPLPRPFQATAEIVLNRNLLEAFRAPDLDLQLIRSILEEARLLQVGLEGAGLEYALRKAIERLAARFQLYPLDSEYLQQLEAAVTLETELPFVVHLWKVQNIYYEMLNSVYPRQRRQSDQGQEEAVAWVEHFDALGEKLSVRVDYLSRWPRGAHHDRP
jgi:alpha-amylase/alpha-mannosidase (GH57 family)